MPVDGLLPIYDTEEYPGAMIGRQFLSFIIPAIEGCDLECPFCFIRQRKELTASAIPVNCYTRFIREAAARTPIFAVSIQGYEPLLPASRPYTQAILATARLLSIPTGLVTNGTHLAECANWVATLAPTKIAVSLDAAAAPTHDRLRGVSGAWAATISGIERAVAVLAPRTAIAVASVLMPSGPEPLLGMPTLLGRLGITDWIVTPLQKIGRDAPGGPVGDRRTLYRSLKRLQDAADATNVRLTIDDELDCLQHEAACTAQPGLRRFRVRTIPKGVDLIRLGPDGACSVNRDILRRVTPETPRWRPDEEHAGDFLARLLTQARGSGADAIVAPA